MTPTSESTPDSEEEVPSPPTAEPEGPSVVSVPRRILHLEPDDRHFSGNHKLTLAQIEYWSLTKGLPCWASDAKLADAIGVSEPSIERYVKKLEACGHIAIWDAGQPDRVLEPLRPDWRADWPEEKSTPWSDDWKEGKQPPDQPDTSLNGQSPPSINGEARASINGDARSSINGEARTSINGDALKQSRNQKESQVAKNNNTSSGAPAREARGTPAGGDSSGQRESGSGGSPQDSPPPLDRLQRQPGSGEPVYPFKFERLWNAYPERAGGNSKRAAYRAWRALIAGGDATPEELLQAVREYAEFCREVGRAGTRYVKVASNFLQLDGGYGQDWTPPKSDLQRQRDRLQAKLEAR